VPCSSIPRRLFAAAILCVTATADIVGPAAAEGRAAAGGTAAGVPARPPAAPVRAVTDTHFGVAVSDPYRYFEDVKHPEFAAWLKAEADYAHAVLTRIPGRDTLYREIEAHGDAVAARVTDVQVVGNRVYYQKRLANENLPRLYVREGFAGRERLLVNPEAITTPDGKHSSLDYYAASPDNRHVAYGISPAGSEDAVLRVIEVATGRVLPDEIDDVLGTQVETLATVVNGMNHLQMLPYDYVMIIGFGPIGYLFAQFAKNIAAKVAVTEIDPYRIGVAKEIGELP